jgi:hypothetical protein
MPLFWPKDAEDFSQNIDLNKKDKEDIQNICGLLGKNKIIKSLGVAEIKIEMKNTNVLYLIRVVLII